jgi:hypothetical protein
MKTGTLVGGYCGVWFLGLILVIIMAVWVISSGGFASSKELVIDGKTVVVEPYGLGNEDSQKNPDVIYELSTGNIVLSVIFSETVVVPVVLITKYLYEPVGVRHSESFKK